MAPYAQARRSRAQRRRRTTCVRRVASSRLASLSATSSVPATRRSPDPGGQGVGRRAAGDGGAWRKSARESRRGVAKLSTALTEFQKRQDRQKPRGSINVYENHYCFLLAIDIRIRAVRRHPQTYQSNRSRRPSTSPAASRDFTEGGGDIGRVVAARARHVSLAKMTRSAVRDAGRQHGRGVRHGPRSNGTSR